MLSIQQNMLNRSMNIVLSANPIEEGLNFIVPKDWWNELLDINRHVRGADQIIMLDYHPLQVLSEIGIISLPYHQEFINLKNLDVQSQKMAKEINQDILDIRLEEKQKGKKRNRSIFEWWDFQKINLSDIFSQGIICPLVERQMLETLSLNIEWKVVSPKLYKLFCQKEPMLKGEQYRHYLVGIPVFLRSREVGIMVNDLYKRDMDYMLGTQITSRICYYNSGCKYGISGYLQNKLTYGQVSRYLFEGLLDLEKQQCSSSNPRQIISYVQEQVYSNIQDAEKEFPKWSRYQGLNKKSLSGKIQIVQFSSFIKFAQTGNEQLFQHKQPVKKIKNNTLLTASYLSNHCQKGGFQPTIISSTKPQFDSKVAKFMKIKKDCPFFFTPLINKPNNQLIKRQQQKDIDLQTHGKPSRVQINLIEEQTRSQDIQSANATDLQKLFQRLTIEQNRIQHPIWKGQYRHKSLKKMSEAKMSEHIPVPFSNSDPMTIKVTNNGRVQLIKKCNKLAYNQQGQLLQRQAKEQIKSQQQKQISFELSQYLQTLALQLTKKVQPKVQYLCKEEAIEVKDKFQLESQTCKNEGIDDLDQVQSRQC